MNLNQQPSNLSSLKCFVYVNRYFVPKCYTQSYGCGLHSIWVQGGIMYNKRKKEGVVNYVYNVHIALA